MIKIADLTFSYPRTDRPAVDGLSFQVDRGEIFGFLGPSGAGKSTTQRILIGLQREFEGAVCVLGKALTEWGADYYERIGVAFELPNHYLKLTALENLTYFRSLYNNRCRSPEELLEWVGLGDDGTKPVGQFSKGMKGRLSVARALLNNPDLLFLDEPTAGLDPVSARNIKNLIREQQGQGKTVFLTTHDMSVADQLCDRVAFIIDGKITLIDSPRALKLRYGERRLRIEFLVDDHIRSRELPLDGLSENPAFLDLLRSADVQTLHSLEATLEDIFIQVTGQSLR